MVIYADILFLLNAFISYVCLLSTALVLHAPLKRVRFLLASLLGGFYALSVLVTIPVLANTFLKFAVCIGIIFTAFGKLKLRQLLVHTLFFLLMNVILAGVVLLLSRFNSRDFYSDMYAVYINLSPLMLITCLALCYALVLVFTKLISKRLQKNTVFKVKVHFAGECTTLFGFCDSGNHLTEPFSALPVCIVKENRVQGLAEAPYPRIIPFSALGGEGLLQAVKVKMEIYEGSRLLVCTPVYLAQNKDALKDMQYDIIINPKVFEETEILHETENMVH